MEALIAISGLLAAVGVGAVGIGFARSRTAGPIPASDAAAGLTAFTNAPPGPLSSAASTLPLVTAKVDGKTITGPGMVDANGRGYILINGYQVSVAGAVYAVTPSATTQPGNTQTLVAAAAAAAATAAGNNQANLDRELQDYTQDGFTLGEAEIVLGAGGQSDPVDDLQAKVYPGWSGHFDPTTDKIVRVPWAPAGAPTSVGTPGGAEPTSYGLVVPL